ncbi:AcrR family transcriptional regulator [Bacillus fengqiuensis]|nr:AcrR family transcriptional regulator [Bacillus fengqiuensis]
MPRFSENEKDRIKECLLEKGKELFLLYGLKKTSIDSIISACGIAKGTFYTFFDSKEDLFLEIWMDEEAKYNQFLTEIMLSATNPKDMLIQVCKGTFEYLEMNPFHRNLYERNEIDYLIRKLPPGRYETLLEQDHSTFIPLLEQLQKEGQIISIEPEIIMGIHRCLTYLPLLKQEVGADIFPKVVETMIMFIAEGLTNPNKQ